jgi:hypothetical protein
MRFEEGDECDCSWQAKDNKMILVVRMIALHQRGETGGKRKE